MTQTRGPLRALRRHPVLAALGSLLVVAVFAFVFGPWSRVSSVRRQDAEIRRAVAPLAQRLRPMHEPAPVSGWELRVQWVCDAFGVAGDPYVPLCESVPSGGDEPLRLAFAFVSDEPTMPVCRAVTSFVASRAGCVVEGQRHGDAFLELEGWLTTTVRAEARIRKALVAPGGGIVDPAHPVRGATLRTVVSVEAWVGAF